MKTRKRCGNAVSTGSHRTTPLSLSNHADPYFLAWWSLTAQKKGLFQGSNELKNRGFIVFHKALAVDQPDVCGVMTALQQHSWNS